MVCLERSEERSDVVVAKIAVPGPMSQEKWQKCLRVESVYGGVAEAGAGGVRWCGVGGGAGCVGVGGGGMVGVGGGGEG